MSFDAQGMIEVNFPLILQASELPGEEPPLVVSVATWGRGCKQETLQALEPYRHGLGFNGSVVARPPRALAAELFEMPELQTAQAPAGKRTQVLGVAFKSVFLDWLEG
ncbi:MAG: hypothetical protein AB7S38_03505 [Vulcanimicrobiota bacterium]